ncbi:MarR family winged helix-turn-helix transcriptional regulator [Pseudogemmobacter hezensis]|uniref:MarR family winged helix-turn-helix transcriptional regulator n=1 Tax=Pseudogemmobacter hezensis TaxID=2737662 RepID=UPI0020A6B265|nr:MarR family transcriptional regulator [Pseudogemmobacter hezensis]
MLEQKHLALLDEAQRRGQPGTGTMRLCFELLSLASGIDRACAGRLAPHRLSEGKFVLLFLLRDLPDGLAPHELADRAGVTRATVTGLLDGLERDGFLARSRDHQDRRQVTVRLTAQGQALAAELFQEHSQWIAGLFSGLSESEREVLSGLLQRVWRNLAPTEGDRR